MQQGQSRDPLGGPVDEETIGGLLDANTDLWIDRGFTTEPPPYHSQRPPSNPGTAYEKLKPLKADDSRRPTGFVTSKMGRPDFVAQRGKVPVFFESDDVYADRVTPGQSLIRTYEDPSLDLLWLKNKGARITDNTRANYTQADYIEGSAKTSVIDAFLEDRGLVVHYYRTDVALPPTLASSSGRPGEPARSTRRVRESYHQVETEHDQQLAEYRQRHPEGAFRQTSSGSRDGNSKAPDRKDSARSGHSRNHEEGSPSSARSSRRGSIGSGVTDGGGIHGWRELYTKQTVNYKAGVPYRTWDETDEGSVHGFPGGPVRWKEHIGGSSRNEDLYI